MQCPYVEEYCWSGVASLRLRDLSDVLKTENKIWGHLGKCSLFGTLQDN